MKIKLEEAVSAEKVVLVQIRPVLVADKCDGCGKIYRMDAFHNDRQLGELHGTFADTVVDPETDKEMGNTFLATVCSFLCAHEVFANGGWRKIPQYRPYADADIPLGRASLTITTYVKDEAWLRKDWGRIDYSTYIRGDQAVDHGYKQSRGFSMEKDGD